MQVFLEADSSSVLGIPYGSAPDRRFWNVKKYPEMVDRIPELSDCPELKEFVRAANSSESRFATLGSEKWCKHVSYPNGATKECGIYVDIMFDTVELCGHENYEQLAAQLKAHGDDLRATEQHSDLTLIRIQPQKIGFRDTLVSGWMAAFWIYGVGNSHDMAAEYCARGLRELMAVLAAATAEVAQGPSQLGTRVFDQLPAFDGDDP